MTVFVDFTLDGYNYMKLKLQNYSLLLTGLLMGVLVSIGHGVFAERDSNTARATLPIEELRTFTDVFGRIKNDYVVEVDDKELIENAIRGMLSGLDPHSSYLDAEDYIPRTLMQKTIKNSRLEPPDSSADLELK